MSESEEERNEGATLLGTSAPRASTSTTSTNLSTTPSHDDRTCCFCKTKTRIFLTCLLCLLIIGLVLVFTLFEFHILCWPDRGSKATVNGQVTFDGPPPPNTTIAYIADVGLNEKGRALYELVKRQNVHAVYIAGDFDYVDDPNGWMKQINDILGADMPIFVSAGNHDECKYPSYGREVSQRYQRLGITTCNGIIGVEETCSFKGILFVSTAPGIFKGGYSEYITQQMDKYKTYWKVCGWHKNQHLMQTGDKSDETGWGPYQACLQEGAMIYCGHEHQYSRTVLMNNFQSQLMSQNNETYKNVSELTLSPGSGFVVLNGLGGHSVRTANSGLIKNPWWAKVHHSGTNAKECALICQYNIDGQANLAHCVLKQVDDKVIDEFYIHSGLQV